MLPGWSIAGLSNPKALLHELTVDQIVDYMLYMREKVFLMCDEETRRTGRLCKAVTVVDMNFTSLAKVNRQFAQVQSKTSKLSEIYYPQAMDIQVMVSLHCLSVPVHTKSFEHLVFMRLSLRY